MDIKYASLPNSNVVLLNIQTVWFNYTFHFSDNEPFFKKKLNQNSIKNREQNIMTTLGYVCSKITFKYTCDFILNTLNDVYR